MSANLTFTGSAGAAYSVPASHTATDGTWSYDSDGVGIVTAGSFARLFDNSICSGIVSAEIQMTLPSGASYWSNGGVIFMDSALNGVKIEARGDAIVVGKEIAGSNGANITTYSVSNTNSTFTLKATLNISTGAIEVFKNGASVITTSYTDFLSNIRAGMQTYRDGAVAIPVDTLVTVTDDAGSVTIDTEPTDIRVTESRTIRITVPTTAPTTGNTTIKVDDAGNDAIVPSSVFNVSGLTYDINFTVPDAYAGLPYSNTGYAIIVDTTDGTATSGNVDFLPVTGNDFVTLTAAPGDFNTSLGTLAIGDMIEWETNGGDITVNADATITSANPTFSFDARAWDATDSTWGSWATQSAGSSGGNGLIVVGLTSVGLTITGLVE